MERSPLAYAVDALTKLICALTRARAILERLGRIEWSRVGVGVGSREKFVGNLILVKTFRPFWE